MRRNFSLQSPACQALRVGRSTLLFALWLIALRLQPSTAYAQQQFQGVCSQVKMVIQQQLALERIGFDARLEISNNDGSDPITDFSATPIFENPALSTTTTPNDASSLFFVRAPTFESVNSISGDGVIAPATTAVVRWFIIPKPSAGGATPNGMRYLVGCRLAGKIRGLDIPSEVMFAVPANIFVHPEPQLDITYFQPRDVQGMDPFTGIGTPIPFTLGVIVKNVGYGAARSVNINSQQPRILENRASLLLIAQLLGSRVADVPVQPVSLNVNLGDIPPGQSRKGAWDMITSLSGEFVQFSATYTHASELGGQDTSIIRSLQAHFIAHEVLDDRPGQDGLKDFLVDTNPNHTEVIPDSLYESAGDVLPVNLLLNAAASGSAGAGGSFLVNLTADRSGWGYVRLGDPGQAKLPVAGVTRSDGKILNTNNYWTSIRYEPGSNTRSAYLHLFDLVETRSYSYTVTYAQTSTDTNPPVTTMHFAGPVTRIGDFYHITPDTRIYFMATDEGPVNTFYSLTNGPDQLAMPFSLPNAGTYQIVFYSTDTANNREVNQTNTVVVSSSDTLDFANIDVPDALLLALGDALSIRPTNSPIAFRALPNPSQVDARIDIFQGVDAWARVDGVPSSPTADTSAALRVSGERVDFFRYRLGGGSWHSEQPVSSPVVLADLKPGTNTVSILGRSEFGGYPDESNAVSVNWVVDPDAWPTRITGAPATPSQARSLTLSVGGTGVTAYRWTLNNGYYRAETNAPGLLSITVDTSGPQSLSVAVLGKTNDVYQPTNRPTSVAWDFLPLYGFQHPGLALVRSVSFTNIGTSPNRFLWDGRADSGDLVTPGCYTVRLTLQDQLGRTNFSTRVVRIGDLTASPQALADLSRGPNHPHARGHWAVWEDQSDGHWQIYAQDLSTNLPIRKLTQGSLDQQHPRTDGRYVVWQGCQPNGTWDLFWCDLATNTAPQALTSSARVDEINPVIDWPWVAFQRRSLDRLNGPWQVYALNLATNYSGRVWQSAQDQVDPDIHAGQVVWQDWRDAGPGEIYYKNLESGVTCRITTNSFGQYHPAIFEHWIAWQDTRLGQTDIYGFDLLRNAEVRLTSSPENEAQPFLDGPWLLCQEDSLPLASNLRLVHLPSLGIVPITRSSTVKQFPALAGGRAVWLDSSNNLSSVLVADLPALQAVFQNRNLVAVTEAMAAAQQDAFTLLALWRAQAGLSEITRYVSLWPEVVTESAVWTNGGPTGVNFPLAAGGFLWTRFSTRRVVDLGLNSGTGFKLAAGPNVFSYARFPSQYSAYKLLDQVGLSNARAVRMLDAQSGKWVVAEVFNGRPVGADFSIPTVAVLMLELANPINQFIPR